MTSMLGVLRERDDLRRDLEQQTLDFAARSRDYHNSLQQVQARLLAAEVREKKLQIEIARLKTELARPCTDCGGLNCGRFGETNALLPPPFSNDVAAPLPSWIANPPPQAGVASVCARCGALGPHGRACPNEATHQ